MSTLRGHADSVNEVAFLPFLNTLVTCSADKSVSLWDTRTVSSCMSVNNYNVSVSVAQGTVYSYFLWSPTCMPLSSTNLSGKLTGIH